MQALYAQALQAGCTVREVSCTWSRANRVLDFAQPLPAALREQAPHDARVVYYHAPAAPHWPGDDGTVKIPAAWLIERAGFGRGFGGDGVSISTKHTLALTNRGTGSTAALLDLARTIRDGVRDRFGIELHPEPVLVDCAL